MTRKIHDQFAKEWCKEVLTDFGTVEIEKQLSGEIRTIDVLFKPHFTPVPNLPTLGILGRITTHPCILEAFRNPVPEWEIRNCREKLFSLEAELTRQAKQQKQKLRSNERPFAWILTPTFSPALQKKFRVIETKTWGNGIYFLADPDRTAVVAIHHLPKNLNTLWLRLLGRDRVQAEAVREILALPLDHPYRQPTIHHLSILQITLQARQNKTKDIREVLMSLSPAYEKWRQENITVAHQEGRQEGRQETQMEIALRLLGKGMSVEDIAQCTGLSIETIQTLQN